MKSYDDICVSVYRASKKECAAVPLEALTAELLSLSMPGGVHIEALRAQGVIIRTNIARQLSIYDGKGCGLYPGADICDTGHCFDRMSRVVYTGAEGDKTSQERGRIIKAAAGTRGEIITVNDRPVMAYCHECCGGATENAEDIIGNKVAYLRRVLCDYCKGSIAWEHEREFLLDEIRQRLDVKVRGANDIKNPFIEGFIEDINCDDSGRVRSLRIGGKSFKGTDVRGLLGLASTRFTWKPTVLKFICRGRGHGLGMCQYGAAAMARNGSNYREMINYYFTGVQITAVAGTGDTPLKGKVFVLDPGHGGDDNDGHVGPGGLREKDVNLDIALKLKGMLEGLGAKVCMTRSEDANVLLSDRADMANRIRPHFFISIHQNNFYNPGVSGTEIYYYNGDTRGERLGRCIMDRLVDEIGALNRGVQKAAFFVLREVKVSSLQLELFYITNPGEEEKLRDGEFRTEVARVICNGIMSYYGCRNFKSV